MKLKSLHNNESFVVGYSFQCPGCDCLHIFYVRGNVTWTFDGNIELPTFDPSLRLDWKEDDKPQCCHLTLTKGKIKYHSDSTLKMSGQILDLLDHPSP